MARRRQAALPALNYIRRKRPNIRKYCVIRNALDSSLECMLILYLVVLVLMFPIVSLTLFFLSRFNQTIRQSFVSG